MPARQARAERCGNSWASSAPHLIVTLTRPCEDPSVTPKTPPRASRGLGLSHSISIGDGAVSPPRSGFVLRCCIRKANGALAQAVLADGLADTSQAHVGTNRNTLQSPLRGLDPEELRPELIITTPHLASSVERHRSPAGAVSRV